MNKTKHTPRPWNAGTVEGNETRYTQPIFSGSGKCIGVVYGDIDNKWTEEHRANVRLIAAAPELLEACQKIVECAPELWGNDPEKWPKLMNRVEAAITKAEPEE